VTDTKGSNGVGHRPGDGFGAVAVSTTGVIVSGADINDADADAVVLPIDSRFQASRLVTRAVIGACDSSVRQSLDRLAAVLPTGIAPGAVVAMPAPGHRRFTSLFLVVMFDNRVDGATHVLEPDDARLEGAVAALGVTLSEHGLASVAVAPLGGRALDAGEVGATVARILTAAPNAPGTFVFVEKDDDARANIGAAIESIGIDVINRASG
jgi:hypothetical protein